MLGRSAVPFRENVHLSTKKKTVEFPVGFFFFKYFRWPFVCDNRLMIASCRYNNTPHLPPQKLVSYLSPIFFLFLFVFQIQLFLCFILTTTKNNNNNLFGGWLVYLLLATIPPPLSWLLARRVVEGCARVCVRRKCGSGHPLLHFLLLPFLYYYDFFFLFLNPPQALCQKSKWSVSNERFLFDPYTRTISPHSHVLFIFYPRLKFWYQLFFSSYLNNDEYRSYPSTYPNFFVRDKEKKRESHRKEKSSMLDLFYFFHVRLRFPMRILSPPLVDKELWAARASPVNLFFFLFFPFLSFLSYLSSSLPHRNVFNR